MFPTIFIPSALSGLAGGSRIVGLTVDLTPALAGLALAIVAAAVGVWVHRNQEAKSLAPARPRLPMRRIPTPATA